MVIEEAIQKRKEIYKERIKKYPIENYSPHYEENNRFYDIFLSGFVSLLQWKKDIENSKGSCNIETIANLYEEVGGKCIAIATEPYLYAGSDEDLIEVKKTTKLPLLRKDFIIDEYQIYESKMIGADAIELYPSIISFDELRYFLSISKRIGLGCVTICKKKNDIDVAIKAGAKVIGVLSKSLINYSLEVIKKINENDVYLVLMNDQIIRSFNDLKKIKACGFNGVLLGDYLLKSKKPEKLVKEVVEI